METADLESAPPPAEGVRLDWRAIPLDMRSTVEQWLGSRVASVASQPTGFSPGVAARIRLADGRRVFVKAVSPTPNADAPAFHRREAQVVAALPAGTPVPRLLHVFDEGEAGWVVLLFEDVDGRPPAQPWQADELARVLDAIKALAAALTPAPLSPAIAGPAGDKFGTSFCGWRRLRDEQPSRLPRLDAWSRRRLAALVELEATAPAAVAGDTLLHCDIRADNLLLAPEQVWFVDWPHACVGAAWVDSVLFAPSVTMQGGPPPEQVLVHHPAGRTADPAAVTAAIVALAGMFTHRALQPPPPGLPTLRAFQAAQGAVARAWVAQRTGWS
jgi:aminoglycoside phosphotransferase (APT) family kinase protein